MLCVENPAENLLPGGCAGEEQVAELPLGNHGDLRVLVAADPQDFRDFFVDGLYLGDDLRTVRQLQFGLGLFRGCSAAAQCWSQVGRIASDPVVFAVVKENHLHIGGGVRRGVAGAEGGNIPDISAGLAEQGEADGVENGGFARSGLAGDDKKPLFTKAGEVYFGFSGVGAEGGEGELQRSHASSSQIFRISVCRYASCSMFISVLFWMRYSSRMKSAGLFSEAASGASTGRFSLRVRLLS